MSPLYKFRLHHYWAILIAVIFLLFIASLMKGSLVLYVMFAFSLLGVFSSVIASMWEKPYFRVAAIICGGIGLASSLIWVPTYFSEGMVKAGLVMSGAGYSGFILIAIISMLRSVFKAREASADRIVGSICIYLMIGMFFAFVFATLDILDPNMFRFGFHATPEVYEFRQYLYFSYTTLTTLGYGDMIPLMPISRLLASIEAMVGPVYLAIMVAGLVGQYVSESFQKK